MTYLAKTWTKKDLTFKYVRSRDLDNLQVMLSGGSADGNLSVTDVQGCSLLHRALEEKDNDMCLKFLLERCPRLTAMKNNQGATALLHACSLKHTGPETLRLLLEINPSAIHDTDNRGCTPLHVVAGSEIIACSGQPGTAKTVHSAVHRAAVLVAHGALVNVEDNCGMTPLHYAIQSSANSTHQHATQMIELLLQHKAKVNTNLGINSINLALKSNIILQYILEADPSSINEVDKNGLTPLQCLIIQNDVQMLNKISLLVKYGANISSDTIDLARAHDRDFCVVEELLDLVPMYHVNTTDQSGTTMLIQYSYEAANVLKLLHRGASVNVVTSDGRTALYTAVSSARDPVSVAHLLLKEGANPLIGEGDIITLACEKLILDPSKYFELVEIFLTLPCFTDVSRDNSAYFNNKNHPQRIILENLHFMQNSIELYKVFTLIMKSNLKTSRQLLINCCVNNLADLHFKVEQKLNCVTCLLNCSLDQLVTSKSDCKIRDEFYEILDLMTSSGWIERCPAGTMSPLTLLLSFTSSQPPASLVYHANDNEELIFGYPDPCSDSDSEDYENSEELMKLVRYFISHNVNINHTSLTLQVHDQRAELRDLLCVPDALWVACLRVNIEALRLLIPYWSGGPPLAMLLLLDTDMDLGQVVKLMSMFLKYGGVPQGTRISKLLHNYRLRVCQKYFILSEQHQQVWQNFSEVIGSPASLLDLARLVVRQHLAVFASHKGNNLPQVLEKMSPPGLNNYLLMKL